LPCRPNTSAIPYRFTVAARRQLAQCAEQRASADQVKADLIRIGRGEPGYKVYDLTAFAAVSRNASEHRQEYRAESPACLITNLSLFREFVNRPIMSGWAFIRAEFYNLPNTSHFNGRLVLPAFGNANATYARVLEPASRLVSRGLRGGTEDNVFRARQSRTRRECLPAPFRPRFPQRLSGFYIECAYFSISSSVNTSPPAVTTGPTFG